MKSHLEPLWKAVTTEAGKEWLTKALNPTEPSIASVQMPDGTASDTVAIELTMTQTIGAASMGISITQPWGAKILLTPHMYPGVIIPDEGAFAAMPIPFRYPIFSATSPSQDYSKLLQIAEAWRLCGQSVTIHLDANSTKDSGTIVAAQMVTKPGVVFPGMSATGCSQYPLVYFSEGSATHLDNPAYSEIMALPRPYQANLRQGLYMPLKLSSTCQHWCSMRESVLHVANDSLAGLPAGLQLSTASPGAHPFPFYVSAGPVRNATNNEITGGALSPPFMGDTWGHIAVSGIDPDSSLVFKFRSLLEMKVQAKSSYAPHMRPAPLPDKRAIDNYFTIVRELPDAYPADYNDAGKIMGVIGKAIRTVTPFLNVVPGAGKALTAMADPVSKILIEAGRATSEARKAYKAQGGKGGKKQRRAVLAKVAQQAASAGAKAALASTTGGGGGKPLTLSLVKKT